MITQVLLQEPGGSRELCLPLVIGAASHCDIRTPDFSEGPDLRLFSDGNVVCIESSGSIPALLDGQPIEPGVVRTVRDGAVLVIGETRITFSYQENRLRVAIWHLEGNQTIAPLKPASVMTRDEDQCDVTIKLATHDSHREVSINKRGAASEATRPWLILGVIAGLLIVLLVFLLQFERISVDVEPADASVNIEGPDWSSADSVFALPGQRWIRLDAEGYRSVEREIDIQPDSNLTLQFRLEPLPGVLDVDTGGIAAVAYIDGVEVGRVPGELQVPAGTKTLLLKAERYLDFVQPIAVEGLGKKQLITANLQSSWGKVEVATKSPNATLRINDEISVALPQVVDLPAGVHRLEISAAASKPWRSAVLVKAGEILRIGPIELGAPDAVVNVASTPSGADVAVGGVYRGKTPLQLELAPGLEHEVFVALQGYEPVERRIFAEASAKLNWNPSLKAISVELDLQGDPTNVDVFLGSKKLGRTPLTIQLPARLHRLELRAEGMQSQSLVADLSNGEARRMDYRLVPVGRSAEWRPPQAALKSPTGALLRLMPTGQATLGSERREQGRRANEFVRRVELTRPFYLGTREVTNGDFRRFKSSHTSGFVGKRTLDLDILPVTSVTWSDAVEYCNWLSEQEGLPLAYERKDGKWVLRQPVGTGYRLPSEAEWEFAARYTTETSSLRRYEWGDDLPPPSGIANLAGSEAVAEMARVLDSWQDEYPVVAPPGKYPANALGLFDMTGNVSEWVHDAYSSFDAAGGGRDPFGPVDGARRVVKGSSWRSVTYSELRLAWRDGMNGSSQTIGFRVARYAE